MVRTNINSRFLLSDIDVRIPYILFFINFPLLFISFREISIVATECPPDRFQQSETIRRHPKTILQKRLLHQMQPLPERAQLQAGNRNLFLLDRFTLLCCNIQQAQRLRTFERTRPQDINLLQLLSIPSGQSNLLLHTVPFRLKSARTMACSPDILSSPNPKPQPTLLWRLPILQRPQPIINPPLATRLSAFCPIMCPPTPPFRPLLSLKHSFPAHINFHTALVSRYPSNTAQKFAVPHNMFLKFTKAPTL